MGEIQKARSGASNFESRAGGGRCSLLLMHMHKEPPTSSPPPDIYILKLAAI